MENEHEALPHQEQDTPAQEPCPPRPRWQIWGARIALVIFILLIIMYYINIARGGR